MEKLSIESVKKYQSSTDKFKSSNLEAVKNYQARLKSQFPPSQLTKSLQNQIISEFCQDTSPSAFQEAGCAVCGRLTLLTELQKLSDLNFNLNILCQSGVTQKERSSIENALEDIPGSVLEESLDSICNTCYKLVSKSKLPPLALANEK